MHLRISAADAKDQARLDAADGAPETDDPIRAGDALLPTSLVPVVFPLVRPSVTTANTPKPETMGQGLPDDGNHVLLPQAVDGVTHRGDVERSESEPSATGSETHVWISEVATEPSMQVIPGQPLSSRPSRPRDRQFSGRLPVAGVAILIAAAVILLVGRSRSRRRSVPTSALASLS